MSIFYINLDRDSEHRYNIGKFLEFTDNFDCLNSDFLIEVRKLPVGGSYQIIGEEKRPDKLSYKLYGNFQYWWVLLVYNDMKSVNELTLGKVVQYPILSELENYYFSLSPKQLELEK